VSDNLRDLLKEALAVWVPHNVETALFRARAKRLLAGSVGHCPGDPERCDNSACRKHGCQGGRRDEQRG
jgi:hypothetical protein